MGIFDFLSGKPPVTFETFVQELKAGKRNFFSLLETPETTFEEASFQELMSNTSDVLSGVNRVQKQFRKSFFNCFDACLVKHHDNGDVKWVFFTVTSNLTKVIELGNVLFEQVGPGIYDDRRHHSFSDLDQLKAIANGLGTHEHDEVVHIWIQDDITYLLQYRVNPRRQFSLMVTVNKKPTIDKTPKSKGTILSLINVDVASLMTQEPLYAEEAYPDKPSVYTYALEEPLVGIFDRVDVMIFHPERKFTDRINTNITFYSSVALTPEEKIEFTENVLQIYGSDSSGYSDLGIHEREILEENRFWTGRQWLLNTQHMLQDLNDENQRSLYHVMIHDYADEKGFQLGINGYNELVGFFDN